MPDGGFVATAKPGTSNYEAILVRDKPASQWAEASSRFGKSPSLALAQGLGFILAYLGNTCGRKAALRNYFFNSVIN